MEQISLISDSLNPFKRAGCTFINVNVGKFILIGGANRSDEFNDVWELLVSKNESNQKVGKWSKIEIPLSTYTPRSCQSACKTSDFIFIFGGQNYHENKHYDDLIAFELSSKSLKQFDKKGADAPTQRNSSTLSYQKSQDRLLLLGGADTSGPLNDLFSFDVKNRVWTKESTKGDFPKGIEMHTAHVYETKTNLQTIQKQKEFEKLQKATIVNVDIGLLGSDTLDQPTQASLTQQQPSNMPVLHTVNIEFDEENAIRDDGEGEGLEEGAEEFPPEESKQEDQEKYEYLIVIGGRYNESVLGSIYSLNLDTYEWVGLRQLPVNTCAHCSYLVGSVIYIYGGTDGNGFQDTLYLFDLENCKLYEAEIPLADKQKNLQVGRIASSMAFDEDLNLLLIFGGSSFEDETSQILTIDVNKININNGCIKIKSESEKEIKK